MKLLTGDCKELLATLPENSVDAVVTDPPYGLAFMNKHWDYSLPSVETWQAILRVLKPGGHLLSFGGTRTHHRLVCNIEDAGFEIRDELIWIYGEGFPKSFDISKGIDKSDARNIQSDRRYKFTEWVRSQGITAKQIDEATKTCMGSHYTSDLSQPAIMTPEHLNACRHLFKEIPEWVETESQKRGVESEQFKKREVIGHSNNAQGRGWGVGEGQAGYKSEYDITKPHTDLAKQWQGWGTALKPAHEPICLARKPLQENTITENVLKFGTGGINIDGCRVETEDDLSGGSYGGIFGASRNEDGSLPKAIGSGDKGRWPANLIHDGSEEVQAVFPETASSFRPSGARIGKGTDGTVAMMSTKYYGNKGDGHEGTGNASRYFYCAKASQRDRNEGLEEFEKRSNIECCENRKPGSAGINNPRAGAGRTNGGKNHHPTVKPTQLMRYLCRLITPPNGIVLDPFMGSGSTGKAAILEGFDFIGCELDPEFVEIAKARIEFAMNERGLF